jgi:proteasome lid subunit RPN8/RPN11
MADHAVATYPEECCGVVLVEPGTGARCLRPCRNVQTARHRQDPVRYPATGRTAYQIAPEDEHAIRLALTRGYRLAVIYHSHVDTRAHLSPEDRQMGAVYPEAWQVVLAVHRRQVVETRLYHWVPAARAFRERPGAI